MVSLESVVDFTNDTSPRNLNTSNLFNAHATLAIPSKTDNSASKYIIEMIGASANRPASGTPLAILGACPPADSKSTALVDVESFDKFIFFPKLPIELRLAIWKLAMPCPRKITIYAADVIIERRRFKFSEEDMSDDEMSDYDYPTGTPFLMADPHTPSLLHACHESQALALETYQRIFTEGANRPIYYDASRDVVVSDNLQALQIFCSGLLWNTNDSEVREFAFKITPKRNYFSREYAEWVWIGDDEEMMLNRGSNLIMSLEGVDHLMAQTVTFVHEEWDEKFATKGATDFWAYLKQKDVLDFYLCKLEIMPVIRHMTAEDFEARFER